MEKQLLKQRKQILLELMGDDLYVPMKQKELAVFLQVPKEERESLNLLLTDLVEEGRIQLSKRGKYTLAEEQVVTGIFTAHPNGFGFVAVEGMEQDLFIPETEVQEALHQDTVQAKIKPGKSGRRPEGAVIKVLERGVRSLVGTYEKGGRGFGFVVPDNARFGLDVFVAAENAKGAVDGHKVMVEITGYGGSGRNPEGVVTEILGHANDPGVDILSIIKGFGLPEAFPEKAMAQAERTAAEVSEADMAGRLDLRNLKMVTIDGEEAKDLDDAVSLTVDGETYELGVHIADVANYVQEGSALDKEALNRGTSVYLVDRVIPMLPHKLSNGICSLNAGEDRLALSCLMRISQKGVVESYRIAETVIRVDERMTYTSVNRILQQEDAPERETCRTLVPMLLSMGELAGILRRRRRERGSIDFDFPETKIVLDKQGHPIDIKPYERNAATRLIEDFMLVANETVAESYYWQELPFLYRTHDVPDKEKIRGLATFIHNFGYSIKAGRQDIHPKELQKLLGKIEGSPEEPLISRLTLRSMRQAKYTVDCTGHFGLACQYYCHFTSPIRRYPDLQIHRIIKENLRGRLAGTRVEHYESILPEIAGHTSKMERRADEAERETDKLKKAEYMEKHIGEYFDGVISGVTKWGIFVELPNTVEGMIHVSKLPGEYFNYREDTYEMVGEATGKSYKLGQRLRIRVRGVDRMSRTIDFEIPPDEE